MHLIKHSTFAFLFFTQACVADDSPQSRLQWVNDKWLISNPAFMRLGNESDPVSTTHIGFDLYYHKWGPCNTFASGSSGGPNPELCGLDFESSNLSSRCSMYYDREHGVRAGTIPHPKTLWRPCQGRWIPPVKMPKNCEGLTYDQMQARVNGCIFVSATNVEDLSERPWIKWRVAAFESRDSNTLAHVEGKPWSTFKSIVVEVVNGQRFYPGGKPAPDDHIIVYESKFTLLGEEMKCGSNSYLRDSNTAPKGTYTCRLEVNHVKYNNETDPHKTWMGGGCLDAFQGWPFPMPPCLMQSKVDHHVIPLSEFKSRYWR